MKEKTVADLVYERADRIADYLKGVYATAAPMFSLKTLAASLAMADTVAACEILENKGLDYEDKIYETVLDTMKEPDPAEKRELN